MPKKEKEEMRYILDFDPECASFANEQGFHDMLSSEIKRLNPPKNNIIQMFFMGDNDAYKCKIVRIKKKKFYVSVSKLSVNECTNQIITLQEIHDTGEDG